MSSFLHHLLCSIFFVTYFLKIFLFLNIFRPIVMLTTLWKTLESTIFCVKKNCLFVLSVVEVSSLNSPFLVDTFLSSMKKKTKLSCSLLEFWKNNIVFISRKKTLSLLVLLLFSNLLLIVVCSVIAVTWTSAAGHPLHQAVSFLGHFILLLFQCSLVFLCS